MLKKERKGKNEKGKWFVLQGKRESFRRQGKINVGKV